MFENFCGLLPIKFFSFSITLKLNKLSRFSSFLFTSPNSILRLHIFVNRLDQRSVIGGLRSAYCEILYLIFHTFRYLLRRLTPKHHVVCKKLPKALVALDILCHNIAIKIYCDKNILRYVVI